jgi:putative proteasome-type protease
MVLLSAGNLSISQSVREILQIEQLKDHARERADHDLERQEHVRRRPGAGLGRAPCARARRRLAQAGSGVEFNVSLIFGGQIKGEGMRLFQVYSAGNFIEATPETPYFQVGESKYGKPVLDRVITPDTPLDEAAKCALVSMDSTLKSNLSVGLPLDLVVYEADKLSRPTRWCASTRTTPTSRCCTTAGARSCARCSTASRTRPGTAAPPRCR